MGVGAVLDQPHRSWGPVRETEKLLIFEQCLGRDLQDLIQFMRRSGEVIAFEHVFSLLESRYGQKKSQGNRAMWEALKIPPEDRLTLAQFRRFRLEFLKAWRGVPEVSESESRRHLMRKLLGFMTEKVVKKERDKNRRNNKLTLNPGPPADVGEIKSTVKDWIDHTPLEVTDLGSNDFDVLLPNEDAVQRLMLLNHRGIDGTSFVIKVRKEEVVLTCMEILNIIEEHMEYREEIDLHYAPPRPKHMR